MYRSRCVVFYRDEYHNEKTGKQGSNVSYIEVYEGKVPANGLKPINFWTGQQLGVYSMFPKAMAVYDVAFRQEQFGQQTSLVPVSAEYVEDFDLSAYLSTHEPLRVAK